MEVGPDVETAAAVTEWINSLIPDHRFVEYLTFEDGVIVARLDPYEAGPPLYLEGAPAPVRIERLNADAVPAIFPPAEHELRFRLSSERLWSICIDGPAPCPVALEGEAETTYRLTRASEGVELLVTGCTLEVRANADGDPPSLPRAVNLVGGTVVVGGSKKFEPQIIVADERARLVVHEGATISDLRLHDGAEIEIDGDASLTHLAVGSVASIRTPEGGATRRIAVGNLSVDAARASVRLENVDVVVHHTNRAVEFFGPGTVVIPAVAELDHLNLATAGLKLEWAAVLADVSGEVTNVWLDDHAQLAIADRGSLVVSGSFSAAETAAVSGIDLSTRPMEALRTLRSLSVVQSIALSPTSLSTQSTNRSEALQVERVIDEAVLLHQRRCNDGRLRADWHMLQLRLRHTLADNPIDRLLLRIRILTGDATDLRKCAIWWLASIVLATPLFIAAMGWNPLVLNVSSASAWIRFRDALLLAVFGVFKLVPIGGTDGTSLPPTAPWALLVKVWLTLFMAALVTALVRRVRWNPWRSKD